MTKVTRANIIDMLWRSLSKCWVNVSAESCGKHILEYCRSQGWLLNSQMHRRSPWLFGQMKIMNNLCIWMWMHSVGYVGMYVWGLDMACQKCSTAVSINGSQRQFCAVEFGSWKVVYASSFVFFFPAIDQMVILTPCFFCNGLSYPPFPHSGWRQSGTTQWPSRARHIVAMGFTKTVHKEAPESYKPYYLPFGFAWLLRDVGFRVFWDSRWLPTDVPYKFKSVVFKMSQLFYMELNTLPVTRCDNYTDWFGGFVIPQPQPRLEARLRSSISFWSKFFNTGLIKYDKMIF